MENIRSNTLHTYSLNKSSSTPIVFIHGFTGNCLTWLSVQEKLKNYTISIDLPGHGKSKICLLDEFPNLLYQSLLALDVDRIHLCGYSMGGRLAILFSSIYPDMIESLILESSSIGIKCERNRKERAIRDKRISKEIKGSFDSFISRWESIDMFKLQKERNFSEWKIQRHARLSHDIENLSKSLNIFGVGNIHYLDKEFEKINSPITIITGSEDSKYADIAIDMAELNSNARHVIINNSSHNTHLENTLVFISEVKNHLARIDR